MTTFYCVLRISENRLLYLGGDLDAAEAAATSGTHYATGQTIGAAQCRAAIETWKLRNGQVTHNETLNGPGRDKIVSPR